jgi:hypothetical protein
MTTRRILLGLSFFNQTAEVTDTLKTFLNLIDHGSCEVVLGLENEKARSEIAPVLKSLRSQGWPACYLWDDVVNRSAMRLLKHGDALPFFATFSYGAAVNRLLLLAAAADCEYLVRLDPGTASPPDIARLMDRHLNALSRGRKVISAQYSARVAIRDDFVPEAQRSEYYSLVRTATGIDCRPGRQVTGGAAMTIATQGPPAIVFDNVKVWASDDGFFQVAFGEDATEVQREVTITRSEPGLGLELSAYIARVAAMVILRHAAAGSDHNLALREAREFVRNVATFVVSQYSYDPEVANRSITPQVGAVYDGYENYQQLIKDWPSIAGRLIRRMERNQMVAWR